MVADHPRGDVGHAWVEVDQPVRREQRLDRGEHVRVQFGQLGQGAEHGAARGQDQLRVCAQQRRQLPVDQMRPATRGLDEHGERRTGHTGAGRCPGVRRRRPAAGLGPRSPTRPAGTPRHRGPEAAARGNPRPAGPGTAVRARCPGRPTGSSSRGQRAPCRPAPAEGTPTPPARRPPADRTAAGSGSR